MAASLRFGDSGVNVRIVGGIYRSRQLKTLRGLALRPSSDRLRETLFNILGPAVRGSIFVDAYAGTGAVGIEAASRGAREVFFFENHKPAVALIRKNLESLEIAGGISLLSTDVVRGLELLTGRRVHADFVFVDPPYAAHDEYERVLNALDRLPLLAPGGRVIVEHSKRWSPPDRLETLECERVVLLGDSKLSFYRLSMAA